MIRREGQYYREVDLRAAFPDFTQFHLLSETDHSAVFSVWERASYRRVALKLTRDLGNTEARVRFQREYAILQTARHERIIGVYDYGQRTVALSHGGVLPHFFYTMERCHSDLARSLSELDLPNRVRALEQFLEGLAFLHTKGIAHRDVKPHNLYLAEAQGPDGSRGVKIGDLGIAKDASLQGITQGRAGYTPGYEAPESPSLPPSGDFWLADQYSAAIVCYQILAKDLVFPLPDPPSRPGISSGPNPDTGEYMALRIPERISRFGHPLRFPEVDRVLTRMLSWNPKKRFENVTRAWVALRAAMTHEGL